MLVLLCPQGAFSQTWKPPCQVPPDIAFSVDPNVLLLMDFSGSMQEETYYPPSGYYDYNDYQQVMNEYRRDNEYDNKWYVRSHKNLLWPF